MKRRLLVLLVALAVALAGTGAIYSYVSKADARAVAGQRPVNVLVAKKRIAAGTTGQQASDKGLIQSKLIPEALLPAGAVDDIKSVGSQTNSADIYPGEMLLRAQYGTSGAAVAANAVDIPPGMVAMSVQVVDKERVAGFLVPGSEVAVYAIKDYDKPTALSRLLLRRVKVVAVGNTATNGHRNTDIYGHDGQGGPVQSIVVTVAVTIVQGESLAFASEIGRVYFALLDKSSITTGPEGPVGNVSVFGRGGRDS